MRSVHAKPKLEVASRISYELHIGGVPTGMDVLHRCDNPPCVNPAHLFLGTARDNGLDMSRKGRSTTGEKTPVSKMTTDGVLALRREVAAGAKPQALASRYGISPRQAVLIAQRKRWAHLPETA